MEDETFHMQNSKRIFYFWVSNAKLQKVSSGMLESISNGPRVLLIPCTSSPLIPTRHTNRTHIVECECIKKSKGDLAHNIKWKCMEVETFHMQNSKQKIFFSRDSNAKLQKVSSAILERVLVMGPFIPPNPITAYKQGFYNWMWMHWKCLPS